ncbi:FecCD family ABC transporter permease [Cohnella yongneupensis]|uniref:FecCD family ABC transporter permease n=1 Tax=Cohnella yongneupensis TaxID=425006 RepID=A0ABW0R148_9BACL
MSTNHHQEAGVDSRAVAARDQVYARPWAGMAIVVGGLVALVVGIALCVTFGEKDIRFLTVWKAIFQFNPDDSQHQIIHALRLPRVLGGAIIGACLAVAGAMMQGMTRNPLADSGLLGLNAGGGFALALIYAFFQELPFKYHLLFAFLGAGVGVGLVFFLSSIARGGLKPLRLVLAGAAITALLTALSEGVALYYHIGKDLSFWYAGTLAGIRLSQLEIMFRWVAAALVGAIFLSRSITMLSLGEDVARGLGLRTGRVKAAGMLIVLVLAGAAVSVAGSIGFIGLLIPHLTRKLVGVDYRWIIPCSGVLGALLVIFADLAARMFSSQSVIPVASLIAIIGVPFFLYLAAKEERAL